MAKGEGDSVSIERLLIDLLQRAFGDNLLELLFFGSGSATPKVSLRDC